MLVRSSTSPSNHGPTVSGMARMSRRWKPKVGKVKESKWVKTSYTYSWRVYSASRKPTPP